MDSIVIMMFKKSFSKLHLAKILKTSEQKSCSMSRKACDVGSRRSSVNWTSSLVAAMGTFTPTEDPVYSKITHKILPFSCT